MRLLLILLFIAACVLGYFVWSKNKQLKNADSYVGGVLDADFRTKPKA